jgi:NitT/TauT family transport system substrate-binding protein
MLQRITNAYNPAVFNLPWLVARDEGIFAQEGIDVSVIRGREGGTGELPPGSIGSTEWGYTRLTHATGGSGRIVLPAAAIVSEAVFVRPRSPIERPQDMAGRSVAFNLFRESDYLTLLQLEGLARGEEMRLCQLGPAPQRFEAMMNGSVDAAILVEPYIALAERQGCRLLLETSQQGTEVFGPGIEQDTLDQLDRALSEAVRRINGDKEHYVEYLIAEAPPRFGSLDPEDFHLSRIQYAATRGGVDYMRPGAAFGDLGHKPTSAAG